MKKTPMTLAFAILLLAVTPALAQTAVEPSAPVDTPPVAPNDAYAAPPMVVVPVPDDCKNNRQTARCWRTGRKGFGASPPSPSVQ